MDNLRLPKANSATVKGLKSGLWGTISAVILLGIGLVGALKGVPGCSEAVTDFIKNNYIEIAAVFGGTSGVVGFIGNALNPKTENY